MLVGGACRDATSGWPVAYCYCLALQRRNSSPLAKAGCDDATLLRPAAGELPVSDQAGEERGDRGMSRVETRAGNRLLGAGTGRDRGRTDCRTEQKSMAMADCRHSSGEIPGHFR